MKQYIIKYQHEEGSMTFTIKTDREERLLDYIKQLKRTDCFIVQVYTKEILYDCADLYTTLTNLLLSKN